jgi:hypothetical protein
VLGFESRQLLKLSPAALKYTRELFQRLFSFPALNRIIIEDGMQPLFCHHRELDRRSELGDR